MTVFVALLRGVNVGGKGTLPMAKLRAAAEGLGYDGVATYIQSGNLVLRTADAASKVERDLAEAVAALGGVAPAVVVRSRAQLAKVVDGNPYLHRGEDEKSCHVLFCQTAAARAVADLDLDRYAPDEATPVGKDLFVFLPNGVGRSRLAADLGKAKGTVATMRSWRTVTSLLEMATAS